MQKCDPMDDATNFSSDTDPAETSKLGKHHSSSVNFRDDGGGDVSWGHSKDVKEMCSENTYNQQQHIQTTNQLVIRAFI